MNFSKYIFFSIVFSGIVFSSAYFLVSGATSAEIQDLINKDKINNTVQKGRNLKNSIKELVESKVKRDTTSDSVYHQPKPSFPIKKFNQDSYDDLSAKYAMDAPKPSNVKTVVEYDTKAGNYVLRTFIGESEIATPFMMTEQEYKSYSAKKDLQSYWKEKNSKGNVGNEDKFSLTDMKFNIGAADKIFGPGGVQVKTQGSAELIFGLKTNAIENPALPINLRKNTIFDFNTKIQLNVTGNVGDKLNFGMNYNTESTFDFDQKMIKLAYKGKEDEIIKSLEAGNVSMQLNSSLITGSTALFGLKTELQFGKLNIKAIATQQQSESKTVSTKGGAQTTKFEIDVDTYDANRHFFLGHFFRDRYEKSMSTLPIPASGIIVKRVEAWVTNKRGNFEQARNIVAFMDLGERDSLNKMQWHHPNDTVAPTNTSNILFSELIKTNIRDIKQISNIMLGAPFVGVINGGEDFEKVESARRLDQNEFTFNPTLGYISLKSALNPDEVLGVAYEYVYQGKTYQVGEFSIDRISSTGDSTNTNTNTNQTLIVKLLKSTNQNPRFKMWDLMMKNVYNLGAMQIQPENFQLDIVYRNDRIGTNMQFLTADCGVKNKTLLKVMNLDRLDPRNSALPDGKFDFVEGYTIQAATGRVFFPVLEPFGDHLHKAVWDNNKAYKNYADSLAYRQLYDSTLFVAQQFSEKNKFRLIGHYKSSSGNEIRLNAMNIPRGSVSVTAAGATLIENQHYTVDYTMGTVTILDQGLIESGTKIDVKLENQSMFSIKRKSLTGTHLEYQFNKDFSLGGTIMNLSEMPLTQKINTGNEPINNTIWGMNTSWRAESQWITNALDALPFVNATKPSTIAFNAEFAQLIPGHSSVIGKQGFAYIDDFEATKTSIDIHYPINWYLAARPVKHDSIPTELSSNENRALLSWYFVDPILNNYSQVPKYFIDDNYALVSNHLTRPVTIQELFPFKSQNANYPQNLTVMNLSFYPNERGPYNISTKDLKPDGTFANPKSKWAGITRKIDQSDFEVANIEYVEFWMMDPFVSGSKNSSGDLYFHLGDVSEDVLKDSKKSFEGGMPFDGNVEKTDTTIWGRVPKAQAMVLAFNADSTTRPIQDIGLDGLADKDEAQFATYKNYIANFESNIDANTKSKLTADPFSVFNDPSGDNFSHFLGRNNDEKKLDILQRYKHYNGTEGNSAVAKVGVSTQSAASTIPDVEDINGDNTLSEYERYFQYHVRLDSSKMVVGTNHIVDKVTTTVTLKNGKKEPVSWYQFRIPIRQYNPAEKVGNIFNFKSIRFIRMFLTNFESETHLRFATLGLVRADWRNYERKDLALTPLEQSNGSMDLQAVNVEENSKRSPINYILPPGITRQTDPGQSQIIQLNEQALALKVNKLGKNDARAVYKNTNYDMRQYKRLQMFIHAEKMESDKTSTLQNEELSCFIRIGTDMINNYYEYEIPLVLTPAGFYAEKKDKDRETVWPLLNKLDIPFSTLTDAKMERNKQRVSILEVFEMYDANSPFQRNRIRIKGNPTISNVENIMIGVRNRSNSEKSAEIWVNELRMSEFDESGGWAAMANLAVGLSDIGTVNLSGRTETAGFGSIESNVLDRRKDDLMQYNVSTSLDLGRFLPEKAKFRIPFYYSNSNERLTPRFNPLDQDVLFADAIEAAGTPREKRELMNEGVIKNNIRSLSVSGAKLNIRSKVPMPYDPANFSFNYAINQTIQQNQEIEQNYIKDQKGGVVYNYSFNAKPVEPFKAVKAFDKPIFKIIKDFNFNYLPVSFGFNTNLMRTFTMVKNRDLNARYSGVSIPDSLLLNHSKNFLWNKQFDFKYDLTRAVKLSLQTTMNSTISESPNYTPELQQYDVKDNYKQWKDSVTSGLRRLGDPFTYQQVFSATWNLPINKIPIFDWVNANASYNSNYDWKRMALIGGTFDPKKNTMVGAKNIGNIATSLGSWQVDGQFNFENLYNKSKYLKEVNKKFGPKNGNPQKFESKTFSKKIVLIKDLPLTVEHKLGSDKMKVTIIDKSGKEFKPSYKIINGNSMDITSKVNTDTLLITMVTQDPDKESVAKATLDIMARMVMMVRRASITYRQSNSTTLPGFMGVPGFLGQGSIEGKMSPGYLFTFGVQDPNLRSSLDKMVDDKVLYRDSNIVTPITTAFTSDLDMKANIEPIPGFKIDLNAKRYEATNNSIQNTEKNNHPTSYTGSYNITQIALKTAFLPIGSAKTDYASKPFNDFKSYRQIIASRMNAEYVGTKLGDKSFDSNISGYNTKSIDVLIPAFLAAYTGQDPRKISTNPFLDIMSILPNWRISYDGFSRITWVKEHFKTVTFTHAYTCKYGIGGYTSFQNWSPINDEDNTALGFIRQNVTNIPLVSSPFSFASVSLTEQFSPLFGVNTVLKNSVTTKLEWRKQRNMALNVTSLQLIEGSTDEYVVGAGYILKDFNVILKLKSNKQTQVKNDLKISADLSIKDIKTLIRKLEEDLTQPSMGSKVFSLKVMADYVFSSKMNIQLFFDRQATTPLISSSFPVSTTNFGISFKFMLTR